MKKKQQSITQEQILNKLKEQHPELYEKKKIKIENIKEKTKKQERPQTTKDLEKPQLKGVSPLIQQMALRNLGLYCTERLNIDIYYLLETIHLLIPDVGEEFLEERYKEQGKDWDEIKKNLVKLSKLINKSKVFYDPIEDKSFKKIAKKNPVEKVLQKFFIKTSSEIALMQTELYDLFVFLIKNTTLQRNQIPNEAFKVLEHRGFRKIDLTKKDSTAPEVVAES